MQTTVSQVQRSRLPILDPVQNPPLSFFWKIDIYAADMKPSRFLKIGPFERGGSTVENVLASDSRIPTPRPPIILLKPQSTNTNCTRVYRRYKNDTPKAYIDIPDKLQSSNTSHKLLLPKKNGLFPHQRHLQRDAPSLLARSRANCQRIPARRRAHAHEPTRPRIASDLRMHVALRMPRTVRRSGGCLNVLQLLRHRHASPLCCLRDGAAWLYHRLHRWKLLHRILNTPTCKT